MPGFETTPQGENYREKLKREEEIYIQGSLNNLKNLINNDPGITKQPTLEKGAAVFDYKNMGWNWEIVTRKDSKNNYSVRIKKRIKFPDGKEGWQTQKNGNKDTFNFYAGDKNTFNRNLGAALNQIIGTNRDRLPTTGGIVYELLNSTPKKSTDNSKKTPSQATTPSKPSSPSNNNTPSKPASNPSGSKETKNSTKGNVETQKKTNLREKPIDLHYKEKNKEKILTDPGYPDKFSVEGRITRCLRFASITDAVEDRYGIPRGLLMALMAQEGWGDPTVINKSTHFKEVGRKKGDYIRESYKNKNGKIKYVYKKIGKGKGNYAIDENKSCDGGAGLIHIQAINAAEYGMKTVKRFKKKEDKSNQIDFAHGEMLEKAKTDTGNDLKKLSELDDRFNPVMSVDASARFLMGDKGGKNAKTGDDWINVANNYAGRGMQDYGYSVLVFWTTINRIRGKKMPVFRDKEINKVINGEVSAYINKKWEKTNLCIDRTKKAIDKLNYNIDGKKVSTQEYYKYLQLQWDNYGLSDYTKHNKEHPYKQ